MSTRGTLGVAAVAVALTACAACSASPSAVGLPDDATVTYAFRDASVPPQYHRSETLTVTKDTSHLVIDSYGDVLADETTGTPAAVWQELGSTLTEIDALRPESMDTGCTGGTGASVVVEAGQEPLVDVDVEFCGGTNSAMEAPMAEWIAPARDLFPSTETLAPEGE